MYAIRSYYALTLVNYRRQALAALSIDHFEFGLRLACPEIVTADGLGGPGDDNPNRDDGRQGIGNRLRRFHPGDGRAYPQYPRTGLV